jgi:hypothetical protein
MAGTEPEMAARLGFNPKRRLVRASMVLVAATSS